MNFLAILQRPKFRSQRPPRYKIPSELVRVIKISPCERNLRRSTRLWAKRRSERAGERSGETDSFSRSNDGRKSSEKRFTIDWRTRTGTREKVGRRLRRNTSLQQAGGILAFYKHHCIMAMSRSSAKNLVRKFAVAPVSTALSEVCTTCWPRFNDLLRARPRPRPTGRLLR